MSKASGQLTKRIIDATKPTDREQFLWDAKLPGFGVRIKPSGVKSFLVQYRNQFGRTRRLTIGRYGVLTPDQARDRAVAALAAVAAGDDPAETRMVKRAAPTFRAFAERYMTEYAERKKKASSVREDRRNLDKHLIPLFGAKRVAEITGADVERLRLAMTDTPIGFNRVAGLLSTMMTWAEGEVGGRLRDLNSNPVKRVERFKEKKRERLLSPAELVRLSDTLTEAEAQQTAKPAIVALIRLLIFTGARKSEIRDLRWSYVHIDAGELHLPDSKTGEKVIRLNAPAREIFAGMTRGGDDAHVFAGPSGKPARRALETTWIRIRASAGLEDVRLHDLRHSFGSWSAMAGTPPVLIAGLLGHKKLATTEQYMHAADNPLAEANEAIGEKIAAMMRGETAEVFEMKR